MSWSVNVPKTAADTFPEALEAAALNDTYNTPDLVEQWNEQLAAAKKAALAIFEARPFGAGGSYSASLTGHANHRGDAVDTGYSAHEFIYVSVNREPDPPQSE